MEPLRPGPMNGAYKRFLARHGEYYTTQAQQERIRVGGLTIDLFVELLSYADLGVEVEAFIVDTDGVRVSPRLPIVLRRTRYSLLAPASMDFAPDRDALVMGVALAVPNSDRAVVTKFSHNEGVSVGDTVYATDLGITLGADDGGYTREESKGSDQDFMQEARRVLRDARDDGVRQQRYTGFYNLPRRILRWCRGQGRQG